MTIENWRPVLRESNEGFKTERDAFLFHLERGNRRGGLPSSLKQLEHSIEWPIDMLDPRMHINGWFDMPHFIFPEDQRWLHYGIDVQAKAGTPVRAPVRCVLQSLSLASRSDGRVYEGQADITLLSKESGIVIVLGHLDENSIPSFLREDGKKFHNERREITPGTILGTVGKWPNLLPRNITLPEDVEKYYGRAYDHLHIGVNHSKSFFRGFVFDDGEKIDPLLLFRKLY